MTTNPIAGLALLPAGFASGMDSHQAKTTIHATDAAVARILDGSTSVVEWATRSVFYDGTHGHDIRDEVDARMVTEAKARHLESLTEATRRYGGVERVELATRTVWTLRDGTTATTPWEVAPQVAFCNWCPDPTHPTPAHHPGGQPAHQPEATR